MLVYAEANPKDLLKSLKFRSGDQVIYLIIIVFLSSSLILFGLYVGNVLSAGVISLLFMTLDLIAPLISVTLIFYYQCKLSGIPNTQKGAQRVKYTTIAVGAWSAARFLQFFNSIYFSKQMLEIIRCWQTQDSNLFLSMSLVAMYFVIELLPIYFVIDSNFMNVIQVDKNTEIRHQLTQPLFEKERYYNKTSQLGLIISSPTL